MIDLQIFTDVGRRKELIRRYWKLNDSGNDFEEPMDSIKDDFNLSRGAILGIIRSKSRAVSQIHECECGHQKVFDSRKDFRSTPKQKPFVCETCQETGSDEHPGGDVHRPSEKKGPVDKSSVETESPAADKSPVAENGAPVSEEPLSEDLFRGADLFREADLSGDGDRPSNSKPEKDSLKEGSLGKGGRDTERLRQSLRQLARLLAETSRQVERLSHQVSTS